MQQRMDSMMAVRNSVLYKDNDDDDKKSSYVMASEYFDGDLTVFGGNKEMPFSPFQKMPAMNLLSNFHLCSIIHQK